MARRRPDGTSARRARVRAGRHAANGGHPDWYRFGMCDATAGMLSAIGVLQALASATAPAPRSGWRPTSSRARMFLASDAFVGTRRSRHGPHLDRLQMGLGPLYRLYPTPTGGSASPRSRTSTGTRSAPRSAARSSWTIPASRPPRRATASMRSWRRSWRSRSQRNPQPSGSTCSTRTACRARCRRRPGASSGTTIPTSSRTAGSPTTRTRSGDCSSNREVLRLLRDADSDRGTTTGHRRAHRGDPAGARLRRRRGDEAA